MISTLAFANTIQLYTESSARRLFKARHHEMDKLRIHAQSLTESSSHHGLRVRSSCTVYMFQLRTNATRKPRMPESDASDDDEWLLTRRYSEFAHFRDVMLRHVRQWEEKIDNSECRLHSREFELVSNALRRPITPNFPRKHMRGDNEGIVRERRRGLCAFVRMLLDAYADISVYLFNNPHVKKDDGAGKLLRVIYEELEQFLQVPETQKELERRHTAAVLALEDVHLTRTSEKNGHDHPERTCCICLDDYDSDDDCELRFFSELEESQKEALARDKMVKLPCGHHFHEDCVIEWFNTSVTCPLCRTPVVPEEGKPE